MGKFYYKIRKQEKEIFQTFGETMKKLLSSDQNVAYIDADLMSSLKTKDLWDEYPDRVINVGIAESNMAGIAAGLFLAGMKPYIHSFAPFTTRRNFDQLFVSIAYAGKGARIIASDPGICATENGGTHMTFEDIALMRSIPEACVIDISDRYMFRNFLLSTKDRTGITYIRTPRRGLSDIYTEETNFEIGKGITLKEGSDITIIASGIMVSTALEAAEALERLGIDARVVDPVTIKPLDEQLIIQCAKETGAIVTAENHNVIGGLGSAVSELLSERFLVPVIKVGVQDRFGQVGKEDYLRPAYALQMTDIISACTNAIRKKTGHPVALKYDSDFDSMKKNQNIGSHLIVGDTSLIPNPRISYVIPTFMRPELLKETLYSILEQDHVDVEWEIVVSDNEAGGENETERLIREINDNRIMYYRHESSLGAIGNWNRSIELARSPWVAMCHADDMVMRDHLKMTLYYLEKYEHKSNKPLAYISPQYFEFTNSSQVDLNIYTKRRIYNGISNKEKKIIDKDKQLKLYSQVGGVIKGLSVSVPSNGTIINRKIMIETGGFNPEYGVNTDVIKPYCLAKDYRVYQTLRPLGFYRFDSNATMRPGVIHKMVIGLTNLLEYMYSRSVLTRIWGFFARDEHFDNIVKIMLRYAKYGGYDIKESDFDDVHICRSGFKRAFCKTVYKLVRKIYDSSQKKLDKTELYFRFFEDHMRATCHEAEKIRKSKQPVFFYGAGDIGKRAAKYMKSNKCSFALEGFVVSGKEDNDKIFCGYRLLSIDECVKKYPDAFYIVTTTPAYHSSIIEKLNSFNISDYVCFV